MKKIKIVPAIVIMLVVFILIIFLNSSFGKLLTIKYRGYTEISTRIYIDKECSLSAGEDILQLAEESFGRVETFWGELESEPVIIFSDNRQNFTDLGLSVNTAATELFVFNGAITYIAVYIPGADIDILAHEISHAELHERIYKGSYSTSQLVPA